MLSQKRPNEISDSETLCKRPKTNLKPLDLPGVMGNPDTKKVWLGQRYQVIKYILENTKILTDSEDTVFAALSEWVHLNRPTHLEALELLKHVRLCQLSRSFYFSVLPETEWVKNAIPDLCQMLFRLLSSSMGPKNSIYPEAWSNKEYRARSTHCTNYNIPGRSNQSFRIMYLDDTKKIYDEAIKVMERNSMSELIIPLKKSFYAHGVQFALDIGFDKENLFVVFTPTLSHREGELMGCSINLMVQLTVTTSENGSQVFQGSTGIDKRCRHKVPLAQLFQESRSRLTVRFDVWHT